MESSDIDESLLEKPVNGTNSNARGLAPKLKKTKKEKCSKFVNENMLMLITLVGIAIGFGLGFIVREFKPSAAVIMWIGMPGSIYMRLLKMCIVPLTVSTVISGASSLNPKTNGKLGLVVVVLVMITTSLAVALSVILSVIIKPGNASTTVKEVNLGIPVATHDIFADLFRNIFPDNLVTAAFRQTVTEYEPDETSTTTTTNITELLLNNSLAKAAVVYKRVVTTADGVNILGLITISGVFGVAAGQIRDRVPAFLTFFNQTAEVVFLVMRWFIWLTPIGVVSLIAESLSKVEDVSNTFSDLGLFALTVTCALLIHWLVILPLMYFFIVRKNPFKFLTICLRPASISFAALNTFVAMPDILHVCNKMRIDKRLSHISIPFTITINAAGSSIFIAAATLFICRYSGYIVTPETIFLIGILTIVSCLAIPPVPSASIVIVIIILSAINAPIHNVALLFAMEWFLDRIRTSLNCVSHITIVAMTNTICRNTLKQMDMEMATQDEPVVSSL